MRGPLPVYIEDPVARLRTVKRGRWTGSRSPSRRSAPRSWPASQNFAPPTILAQASRLNFSTRLFNLIVTNVPGPQFPLYVRGRELQDVFPVAFLPKNHALAIAIMSYNGAHELRPARRLRRAARPRRHRRRASRRRSPSCWRWRAERAAREPSRATGLAPTRDARVGAAAARRSRLPALVDGARCRRRSARRGAASTAGATCARVGQRSLRQRPPSIARQIS